MSDHVFVYGSLLSGLGNHYHLDGEEYVGEAVTDVAFTMVSLGGFPGVIDGGQQAIAGELYVVSKKAMAALDQLEGNGRFYTREKRRVTTTTGVELEAWIYLLPARMLVNDAIVSGSWRQHLKDRQPTAPPPWDGSGRRRWWEEEARRQRQSQAEEEIEIEVEMDETRCEGCEISAPTTTYQGMELCEACESLFMTAEEEA